MRKIKKVILLIVVFIIAISIRSNTVFAEYVIQVVPNATRWTEITVSDAYDECQKLNTNSSTLGTTALKAHLTTNADWYAVSLLTYSAYGSKSRSNTTNNSTGITNLGGGGASYCFTSSLMEGTARNNNIASLYDALHAPSPLPYVEEVKNNTNRAQNAKGRGLLAEEMISTSYGGTAFGDSTSYPVVARNDLFGWVLGTSSWYGGFSSGGKSSSVSFRPVIWNK